MPDFLKKTISATQVPALFDASPYTTRWMLYRWFKFGEEIADSENNRMTWGKRMEPLCLAQAAEDLHFDVIPNRDDKGDQPYVRNGLLGCTRDAQIICPDRGPGALETKCVFDYKIWMRDWNGGKNPPRHHEIQLQTQMKVGDGEGSPPYKWGVLAAWCAGEMFYFERSPITELWEAMDAEAEKFFDDLAGDREPDPFGVPIETPLLTKAFPVEFGNELNLAAPEAQDAYEAAVAIAEDVRMLEYHSRERLGHARAEKALKAKLQAIAKTHDKVLLPRGVSFQVDQSPRAGYTVPATTAVKITPYVPADLVGGDLGDEGTEHGQ